ncbi:MAG: hypothetical protein RXR01_05685 [Thermoproteus sp.]
MSQTENKTDVQHPLIPPPLTPAVQSTQPAQPPAPDPKAKAFTDKIMELVSEAYNLATELATIDDPKLLTHPAIKAAQRVVVKVKELRSIISQPS